MPQGTVGPSHEPKPLQVVMREQVPAGAAGKINKNNGLDGEKRVMRVMRPIFYAYRGELRETRANKYACYSTRFRDTPRIYDEKACASPASPAFGELRH
jgi:hypothetical protein